MRLPHRSTGDEDFTKDSVHGRRAKAAGLAGLAVVALLAAGCGSSSSNTASTGSTAAGVPAAATTTAASTTTTAASTSESDLSGSWKGQYGGAYSGTFVLSWQQSGSTLSGKITLSAPASTLDVNGSLHGSSITFGTVGSTAITYTGTVSGSSMSGSYQTPGGGGNWSASKG
jgi:hypothetical protein